MKKEKLTKERHLHNKTVFCQTNSLNSLAYILKTEKRKLSMMAKQPRYRTFTIPKKDGGERMIETPFADLKKVQSYISKYLQSTYYFEKSSSAYGFIVGVRNEQDRRNVLTNAKKHVGKAYMVNIDLKDFFHSVTRDRVLHIFRNAPFNFKRDLPEILANLTTYQNRLPMGTPTSPVLSNFACRELDRSLQNFANLHGWIFTRYADDMTFSSEEPIAAERYNELQAIIKREGFQVNEKKLKFYGPKEEKIITGLVVTDTVTLAPDYIPTIEKEIQQLKSVVHSQNEQGHLSTRWVEQFKRQLRGRINFATFVLPRGDKKAQSLKDAFYAAIEPPEELFGAVSWRGFPYNI